jgi:hypothetical protein
MAPRRINISISNSIFGQFGFWKFFEGNFLSGSLLSFFLSHLLSYHSIAYKKKSSTAKTKSHHISTKNQRNSNKLFPSFSQDKFAVSNK